MQLKSNFSCAALILAAAIAVSGFVTGPRQPVHNDINETLPKCFIYGYVENLVIAEVENSILDESAHSSFEDNTTGNWNFSLPGIQTVSGKKSVTGNRFYSLSSGNITKSFSVLPGKNMIVSYWSRSGAQTVNGSATAQAGRVVSIDGFTWTFYEHTLTNPTTITISGSGLIDEVRLYPYDANMTTYTYDPHAGVTTTCDVNNNITYREYDIFKRLVLIRDQDYKIQKKYCYGVAGTQEDCSGQWFFSAIKTGNFTRNDCGVGYQAGPVTYTVQAGTYVSSLNQATADQLAQNDLDVNGQAYANINGACNFIYYSQDYSGIYYSAVCQPGEVAQPVYVSVPAGMFNSITSQAAANSLAQNYAQNYANTNGQCLSDVTLYYDNAAAGTTLYISLYNYSTGAYTFFEIYSTGSGILGTIAPGTYNIEINNSNFYSLNYEACGVTASGSIGNLNGVVFDYSCSNITIY